jgi:hypothetical protein
MAQRGFFGPGAGDHETSSAGNFDHGPKKGSVVFYRVEAAGGQP